MAFLVFEVEQIKEGEHFFAPPGRSLSAVKHSGVQRQRHYQLLPSLNAVIKRANISGKYR